MNTRKYECSFKRTTEQWPATVHDMENACARFRPWFTEHWVSTWDSRLDSDENPLIERGTYYCDITTVDTTSGNVSDAFRDSSFLYGRFRDRCEAACKQIVWGSRFSECACDDLGEMWVEAYSGWYKY